MTTHPSLHAPPLALPELSPKTEMGRNERCWCGSRLKWKRCHRDRELQDPGHVMQRTYDMREQLSIGRCMHPNAAPNVCSGEPISAHTVQRNGGLSAVSENNHVLSAKSAFEGLHQNQGRLVMREVGVRKASTFLGFCNHHDTTMFRSVEVGFKRLTAETCFLLSFRALAYELVAKEAALRVVPLNREMDKGQPFDMQVEIQQGCLVMETALKKGLQNLNDWKLAYDDMLVRRDFQRFACLGVAFDGVLPIVASGAFHPEYDFEGNKLQRLFASADDYEHITFNITVLDGRSVAIIGWIANDAGPARIFSESFARALNSEGGNVAMRLALEQLENIYFRPSWWRSLSPNLQQRASERMTSGGPFQMRSPDCLTVREPFIQGYSVVERFDH